MALQQFAKQLGQAPRIVLDAVRDAEHRIYYWIEKAKHVAQPPQENPDPSDLDVPALGTAIEHARIFSPECAPLMSDANARIKSAKTELQIAFRSARQQTFPIPKTSAISLLEQAADFLAKAQGIVYEYIRNNAEKPKP